MGRIQPSGGAWPGAALQKRRKVKDKMWTSDASAAFGWSNPDRRKTLCVSLSACLSVSVSVSSSGGKRAHRASLIYVIRPSSPLHLSSARLTLKADFFFSSFLSPQKSSHSQIFVRISRSGLLSKSLKGK